ncbi:MAG: hypothetical protein GX271_02070 [Clostridiales bacterium]|nr:hypothetical protein [Clostridiales bacterium]
MNSDRIKKSILNISVILALILFFFLYYINLSRENKISLSPEIETLTVPYPKSSELKESKNVYKRYTPGEITGVYIDVFSTRDKSGKIFSFSDFDLIADWDTDFNPILDAYVQFADDEKQPKGQAVNMPNATIKVKGNPSASLKSYRIKFMDGSPGYKGQSVFNLNKHLNDPSRIANKLAHDLIYDLQHISGFRTEFVELYIRDDSLGDKKKDYHSYGLYTHIEQPNKTYLRSRGLDENASLYRAENFYFQFTPQIKNVGDSDYDKDLFETVLAIREGKDHTKLIQMLSDINDESKDFKEVFYTYFNEDNYLTWLAINILLGNSSGISEGFLLYNPSDSMVFYLLPWDFDKIHQWMEEEDDRPNIYEELNNVGLHRKYLQLDGSIEKLKLRVQELNNDALSTKRVKSLIKQYKPVLLEMMRQYPDDVLSSIGLNEQIAYLGQIDERILMNYQDFMRRYQ